MLQPRTSIIIRRCATKTSSRTELLKNSVRDLLRGTAQTVAVVTSTIPDYQSIKKNHNSIFHGATLSSFTSIALDPLPLVAFSLRLPSRMALALSAHAAKPQPQTQPQTQSSPPPHMVVNILSAAQPHIARLFSRPDLHPFPFENTELRWALSPDGLPVITGALAALSCSVLGRPMPLSDTRCLHSSVDVSEPEVHKVEVERGAGLASELFIARVLRVEDVQDPESKDHLDDDESRTLPLLYHQRNYTTVRKISNPCDEPV